MFVVLVQFKPAYYGLSSQISNLVLEVIPESGPGIQTVNCTGSTM